MRFVRISADAYVSDDGAFFVARQKQDITKSALVVRGHMNNYACDFPPKDVVALLEGRTSYEQLKFGGSENESEA